MGENWQVITLSKPSERFTDSLQMKLQTWGRKVLITNWNNNFVNENKLKEMLNLKSKVQYKVNNEEWILQLNTYTQSNHTKWITIESCCPLRIHIPINKNLS